MGSVVQYLSVEDLEACKRLLDGVAGGSQGLAGPVLALATEHRLSFELRQ
jgi:hypothetical protein